MIEKHDMCFGCGEKNPNSLKLQFTLNNENKFCADFVAKKEHQGYNGRVHGGIIATLLDEAMGSYINNIVGKEVFTAKMDVRYRNGILIGQMVHIESVLVQKKGRMYEMKGKIFLEDGSLAAEAIGKFLSQ